MAFQSGVEYRIQQKSSDRYLDAYSDAAHDYRAVTRVYQNNDTQRVRFTALGGNTYRVQLQSDHRYLDAYQSNQDDHDYACVTRPLQPDNNTQEWTFTLVGDDLYTIQQLSSSRFLDAYQTDAKDFGVVTREWQNNDTQRWYVRPV